MSRNSPQSERSWRGSSRSKMPERASRSDAKWTLLIFTVLLIAGLVYFLWPRPRMVTHFVTIQTGANDRLAVPFIPSLSLTEFLSRNETYQGANQYIVETDLTSLWERRADSTGNGAASVAERISSLAVGEQDTLILRITAHGACDLAGEGSVDLLCRDFEIPNSDEGPVASLPVDMIFQGMSNSPAEKKLLILDLGNLTCDPRLGSVINQFPQRVAEAIGRHEDPNLWVLLSNAVAQTNALGSPQEQTVFADSVSKGLLGLADNGPFCEEADGFVTLKELYGFVSGSCSAATGGTQTPLLLNGSTQYQYDDIPASISLARLSKRIVPENESSETDEEVDSNDEPKDGLVEETGGTAGEPAEEKPAEKPKVADDIPSATRSNTVARSKTAAMLKSAWRIRDELQSAEAIGMAWRPIDFSPHRWRAVNESLVSLERRFRCGAEQLHESIEACPSTRPARPRIAA